MTEDQQQFRASLFVGAVGGIVFLWMMFAPEQPKHLTWQPAAAPPWQPTQSPLEGQYAWVQRNNDRELLRLATENGRLQIRIDELSFRLAGAEGAVLGLRDRLQRLERRCVCRRPPEEQESQCSQ